MVNQPPLKANSEQDIEALLRDPVKRAEILRGLGTTDSPHLTPSGNSGGSGFPSPFETLTPSRTFLALWPFPMPWFPYPSSPAVPSPWTGMQPPQDTSNSNAAPSLVIEPVATPSEKSVAIVEDDTGGEESDKEAADCVEYLSEEEAGEFRELDLSLKDQESWQSPDYMINFLDKHFNRCLEVKEHQAILEDFPKPQYDVLQTPKLDSEMREQLSKKGKDPQFGSEETLYKIQEQLLELIGPLAYLWSDLTRPDAKPTNEQIVQLVQRALVLVGSTSHAISIERRKIAWGRIKLSLKTLNYENWKDNLFGPGFLEKAAKKMDTDKTLAKVVRESPKPWKRPFEDDPNDLQRFCPRAPRLSTTARGSNARPSRTVPRNITRTGSKEQPREDNRKTAPTASTTTDQSYNVCRENITR